jgi:hypothetical protein
MLVFGVAVLGLTGFHISLFFVWVVVVVGGIAYAAVVVFAGAIVALGFVYAAFFACSNY